MEQKLGNFLQVHMRFPTQMPSASRHTLERIIVSTSQNHTTQSILHSYLAAAAPQLQKTEAVLEAKLGAEQLRGLILC